MSRDLFYFSICFRCLQLILFVLISVYAFTIIPKFWLKLFIINQDQLLNYGTLLYTINVIISSIFIAFGLVAVMKYDTDRYIFNFALIMTFVSLVSIDSHAVWFVGLFVTGISWSHFLIVRKFNADLIKFSLNSLQQQLMRLNCETSETSTQTDLDFYLHAGVNRSRDNISNQFANFAQSNDAKIWFEKQGNGKQTKFEHINLYAELYKV